MTSKLRIKVKQLLLPLLNNNLFTKITSLASISFQFLIPDANVSDNSLLAKMASSQLLWVFPFYTPSKSFLFQSLTEPMEHMP